MKRRTAADRSQRRGVSRSADPPSAGSCSGAAAGDTAPSLSHSLKHRGAVRR